jgi:hypothetical protein
MLYSYSDDIITQVLLQELALLQQENEKLKNIIKLGSETIRCAVCGEVIEHLSVQRLTRGALWCNRKCYEYKPRKIIWLERTFKKDIVEVLKDTTRICTNIKAQCELLGLSIPFLYSTIRKYTKESHITFMAQHAVGKRKELYAKKANKIKSK